MPLLLSLLLFVFSLHAESRIYKPLEDLNVLYAKETWNKSAQEVQMDSLKEYQAFIDIDVNAPSVTPHFDRDFGKPQYITEEQANVVLGNAQTNPIVSLYSYSKYDPYESGIGFCFGRAMFVDLFLTYNGVARGSIKKAFVVGSMKGDGVQWAWHVATIAQSKDYRGRETWLAIDPALSGAKPVLEWYRRWLGISVDGKLRLYITESGKFAQTPTQYEYSHFNHAFYNNYFSDLLKWFDENDVTKYLYFE